MLTVTPYYAAALGLLFGVLSLRVIVVRRSKNIGFGAADDADHIRPKRGAESVNHRSSFAGVLGAGLGSHGCGGGCGG